MRRICVDSSAATLPTVTLSMPKAGRAWVSPARASIFGGKTFEDYVARCRELSLLDQGLLDQPSAPILLVNGRDDLQNSIGDLYLSLDHGDPKAARVFDGGHMGEGPVGPTVVEWVSRQLRHTQPATAR